MKKIFDFKRYDELTKMISDEVVNLYTKDTEGVCDALIQWQFVNAWLFDFIEASIHFKKISDKEAIQKKIAEKLEMIEIYSFDKVKRILKTDYEFSQLIKNLIAELMIVSMNDLGECFDIDNIDQILENLDWSKFYRQVFSLLNEDFDEIVKEEEISEDDKKVLNSFINVSNVILSQIPA